MLAAEGSGPVPGDAKDLEHDFLGLVLVAQHALDEAEEPRRGRFDELDQRALVAGHEPRAERGLAREGERGRRRGGTGRRAGRAGRSHAYLCIIPPPPARLATPSAALSFLLQSRMWLKASRSVPGGTSNTCGPEDFESLPEEAVHGEALEDDHEPEGFADAS